MAAFLLGVHAVATFAPGFRALLTYYVGVAVDGGLSSWGVETN